MDVNENERITNIPFRHKVNEERLGLVASG
jgi:hypothetical protein